MPFPLEKLADNLATYPILEELFPEVWGVKDVNLLKKKGVYPYDYMDSFERFQEDALPPKEAFLSLLTDEGVKDEDYVHAQNVWREMGCQTLRDYHDVYLLTDVMLLADVFEQFRDKCYEVYGLDSAHYYTSPVLAWDAALKYTEVKLDTIADIDQHLFLGPGMRRGTSIITHRHAKANNPYLPDYDLSQPTSFIMYLDANNLYAWAMSHPLPVREFLWVPEEDLMEINITQVADDAPEGYILEVDLKYLKELHDLHNDYPLASENVVITPDMLHLIQGIWLKIWNTNQLRLGNCYLISTTRRNIFFTLET